MHKKTIILLVLLFLTACEVPVSAPPISSPPRVQAPNFSEIIRRSEVWVQDPIPYNMNDKDHIPSYQEGYRADCSGFVSYAWQIPLDINEVIMMNGGANTESLFEFSIPIPIDSLMPGDILNNGRSGELGHTVIFAVWINQSRNLLKAYEQLGGTCKDCGKTVSREYFLVKYDDDSGYTLEMEDGYNIDKDAPGPYRAFRKDPSKFVHQPQVQGASTTAVEDYSKDSETVLVMDVSGSMGNLDSGGDEKITAAKKAARNLLEVIGTEQTAFGASTSHQVGLVSFSDYASTHHMLTVDIGSVRASVEGFYPMYGTAMAAGLQEGLAQFDPVSSAKQILVLMSDGIPTQPLDTANITDYEGVRNELIDIASQAGTQGVCVHAVGFGDPNADPDSNGYIDADLLQAIAAASTCGEYFNANNAGQLANIFLELRHSSLGTVIFTDSGNIEQDQVLEVGAVPIPKQQEQMLFTLNWPGSKLEPELLDPRGRAVTPNYPGATVSEGTSVTSIVVLDPIPGQWRITVIGIDVPGGVTTYNVLMSTRASIVSPTPVWLWASIFILMVGSLGTVMYIAATNRRRSRAPRGGRAYLVGSTGYLKGKRIPLGKKMLLGRGSECHFAIRDLSVSRRHAQIIFTREGWIIQDLKSRGGTAVNGKRVSSARLHSGDTITLGKTNFIFMQ